MRRRTAAFAAIVMTLGSGAGASAREEEQVVLGPEGTTIGIEPPWRRANLDPSFGTNQFRCRFLGADFFLAVFRRTALLLEEEDHRRHLDAVTEGMLAVVGEGEVLPLAFETRPEDPPVGIGGCGVTGVENGLEVRYHVATVAADDVAYLLMLWSKGEYGATVESECLRLARSVAFPGPETEWGRRRAEQVFRATVLDHVVSVRARGTLLGPRDDAGDARLALSDPLSQLNVFVLPARASSAGTVIDAAITVIDSPRQPLEEIGTREDLVVGGRPARTVVASRTSREASYQLVAIDLGEGRWVDLRIEYLRPPDAWADVRRALVEGITVEPLDQLEAWPAPVEVESAPPSHRPAVLALLAGAGPARAIPGGTSYVAVDEDGRAAGVAGGRAWRAAPDGEPTWHGDADAVALDGDALWLRGEDGVVRRVDAEGGVLEGPKASALGPGSTGALAVLDVRRPRAFGYRDAFWLGAARLVELTADGDAVAGRDVPLVDVEAIHVVTGAPEQRRALLVTSRRFPSGEPDRLVEVDLDTGARSDLGGWRWITKLAATRGGWLVTGARHGGARGVHLVTDEGAELLVRGRAFTGVALRGDRLLLQTSLTPPAGEGADALIDVPLVLAREVGGRCGPLDGAAVQAIGEATFGALALDPRSTAVLATRARVTAVAAAARRRAAADGHALGTGAARIDALLHEAYDDPSLGREGRLVLTAWLAEALLAGGAEWVDGEGASVPTPDAPSAAWNPFALAYLLPEVVVSTVRDRDGWSFPARRLPEIAEGRALLIGVDRTALEEEARQCVDVRFERAVAAADGPTLARLFDARPENHYLRHDAYRRLMGMGEGETVRTLAALRAGAPDPRFTDVRAWLAARVALELPDGAPALLAAARSAVARFPGEPSLYLLLGRVWESTDDEDAAAKALLCHRRVLELTTDDGIAEDARAAVERLEAAEREER